VTCQQTPGNGELSDPAEASGAGWTPGEQRCKLLDMTIMNPVPGSAGVRVRAAGTAPVGLASARRNPASGARRALVERPARPPHSRGTAIPAAHRPVFPGGPA
jgi:hypothetical protein